MGLTTAKIELRNPRLPDLPPVIVDALADTGSDHVCIPEHIRQLLALEQADTKRVTLADGTSRAAPYVGPLQLRFSNRTGFAGAVVIGDQPLAWKYASGDGGNAGTSLRVSGRGITPG